MPKVIDFGMAKALGQKLTEKTLFTAFEQMIGTPAYMSPEQAELSGVDVDTRSDIYSLGVLALRTADGRDAVRRGDSSPGRAGRNPPDDSRNRAPETFDAIAHVG